MKALLEEYRRLSDENARLKEELLRDELTGLYNARFLREKLAECVQKRLRRGEEPALLFLDVDHFKAINEQHGHEAGSALLSQIGCRIASLIRKDDLAFRYGGDEFVVLASGGLRGGRLVAERIRNGVAKKGFEVHGLQGKAMVPITLSVGVRVMSAGDDSSTILRAADKAMYEAKRRSRNTVVLAR